MCPLGVSRHIPSFEAIGLILFKLSCLRGEALRTWRRTRRTRWKTAKTIISPNSSFGDIISCPKVIEGHEMQTSSPNAYFF